MDVGESNILYIYITFLHVPCLIGMRVETTLDGLQRTRNYGITPRQNSQKIPSVPLGAPALVVVGIVGAATGAIGRKGEIILGAQGSIGERAVRLLHTLEGLLGKRLLVLVRM